MNTKEMLQTFREVFPGSMVLSRDGVPLQVEVRQPIYCNYQGQPRIVDTPVCQHHLETFDPWCWTRCETEWTIKRLRAVLTASYQRHKCSISLNQESCSANGASRNLWE